MPNARPPRACPCGAIHPHGASCPSRANSRTGYTWVERQRRAATITAWVQQYGWVCPGWQRDPHPVPPGTLTADHITPVAAGGRQDGPLQVACTSCNARRGASPLRG